MLVSWRFFFMAYAISWFLWGLALLQAFRGMSVPGAQLIVIAGAFGPCVAAIVCTGVEGRAAMQRLLRSMVAARQSWIWYVVALFLMPASMTLANMFSGRPWMNAGTPPAPMQPVALVTIFVSILFAAGVGEETGWRGYALPRILGRFRPLTASVVLGCVWAVWHAPLFLLPSTVQHQMLSVVGGLLFLAFCICWSVLFTWLYLGTRGSLFMAILFHTTSDFASVFLQPLASKVVLGILTLLMAAAAIALFMAGKIPEYAKGQ
jgi:membrane protease YdiL (CAAX protease family)